MDMNKIKENQKMIIGAAVAVIAAIVVFVLVKGMGGKTLSCSTSKMYGMDIKSEITVKFAGDNAKSIKMTYDFGSKTSTAKLFKTQMEKELDGAKISISGGKVTVSASKGLSSITGSNKESYKDVKKSIESLGYTCK